MWKLPKFYCLTAVLLFGGQVAIAQNLGPIQSQVLVLDSERAYLFSVAGQQITKDLETRLASLVAENRTIEAELEAEELALTEKRKDSDAAEFRLLADAFDQKVREIRSQQDAKQQQLQELRDADRKSFVESMSPIISGIAIERGALIILERRNVLLSSDAVDITDDVIRKINQTLGNNIDNSATTVDEVSPNPTPGVQNQSAD